MTMGNLMPDQPPVADVSPASRPRWRRRRGVWLVVGITVSVLAGFAWSLQPPNTAEQDALDFVRMDGSTWETYVLRPFFRSLRGIVGPSIPLPGMRQVSVTFPPERLTDNMVNHLLAIDDLNRIALFDLNAPPATRTRLVPGSLKLAASKVSPAAMARFEQRFPHVVVLLVPSPSATNGPIFSPNPAP